MVDSKELCFMVSDDKANEDDNAIWVNSPFFTLALEKMFNDIWKDLQPVRVE